MGVARLNRWEAEEPTAPATGTPSRFTSSISQRELDALCVTEDTNPNHDWDTPIRLPRMPEPAPGNRFTRHMPAAIFAQNGAVDFKIFNSRSPLPVRGEPL